MADDPPNEKIADPAEKLDSEPSESGSESESAHVTENSPHTEESSPEEISSPNEELAKLTGAEKLQRIKYLVDQSQLYAKFLTENLTLVESAEPAASRKSKGKGSRKKRQPQSSIVEFGGKKMNVKLPKSIVMDLHPHQIIGVEWMKGLFQNALNGILADEMGLGKTLQVITFIAYLLEEGIKGPFLIVAPTSTLSNWQNEFRRFAPSINTCLYHANKDERANLRKALADSKEAVPPVVITSYELAMMDARYLKGHLWGYTWQYIIVDEGHRLKNMNCKLIRVLKSYRSLNRMLLTGTPLQNNLSELWALLNFLLPDAFPDLDIFQSWLESEENNIDSNSESTLVNALHSTLRPFILRRLKMDVRLDLPEKREYVIYTGLTEPQKELYSHILKKDAREYIMEKVKEESTQSEPRKARRTNSRQAAHTADDADEMPDQVLFHSTPAEMQEKRFGHTYMQLRLACDSPFLFYYPYFDKPVDSRLENSSGKLLMLDKLLKRLVPQGHKVLIFSQFTKMLDLLEDWAHLKDYSYLRIDGSTDQQDRKVMIEQFTKESNVDLFLLSTRSGGQGINLIAADTVVIFDSDCNPHQDLQAMDRVHRIGQKSPVLIFRLVSGNTVEQSLLERANDKLELSGTVIDNGKFKGIGQSALEEEQSLLHQFERHNVDFDDNVDISDEDFAKMLDRSEKGYANARKQANVNGNVFCRSYDTKLKD